MIKYYLIMLFSGILSAFSQLLLKMSSMKEQKSVFYEYFNPFVMLGYTITAICLVLVMIAYKRVPYKYGAVLESLTFIYIVILSRLFFNEKITRKKIFGNILILIGVVIFSLSQS